jgi:methylenetetrahydrofolate dehydrogenase (NADP+)/methenyltetrahydrofolate cyclohydrolase
MPATILSGLTVRDSRVQKLIEKIRALYYVPQLAIIQIGDRADSTAYIKAKMVFANKVGVEIKLVHLSEDISQVEIVETIKKCNADSTIQGIIIQLPLPAHIDRTAVIETINPVKDVDGLTSVNYNKLIVGDSTAIIPATARGVKELFDYYKINLKGKKVAVVGRSRLVGTPIAVLCKKAGAEVIVCHSKTPDIANETKQADIVIVAVGKPKLIGADHIKTGTIVIDIGISKMSDSSLKGDVDFEVVKDIASMITPVPGGVGPMTVLGLFENVIDACN